MRHQNTLMHQILKPMPWGAFDRLVTKHGADKGVRRLPAKSQLLALVHAQLSGSVSLREIEATMASHQTQLYHLGAKAPKRSTLADANRDRPAALFVELFQVLLAQAHPGLRRASKEAIRLINSTTVTLNSFSKDWACYEAHAPGAKLHVVYDPDAQTPVHFAITPRRTNDIVAAKQMPIEPGATYVFDLGYYDFAWWANMLEQGCRFVTRLKKNTPTTLVEERSVPDDAKIFGRILSDRIVRLPERLKGSRRHPLARDLREIEVVIDTGKVLRIVSSDLTSAPETITDLYKERWQIELFFRWVKQTLKIKKFLGTSANAVRTQLTVALIAFLLLRIAHAAQRSIPSPLTFARLARSNLMHFKSIQQLAEPEPPPPRCSSGQLELAMQ